ncbi:hypothetical protein [Pseudomonas azotoformans]
MNLSAENIVKIRDLVRSGYPLKTRDAKDLQGHNDHLVELLEARGRLMLGVEIERDQLKAENERLSTENSEIESAAITYIEDMQEAQRENARLTELFTVGMTLDGNLRVYGDWQSVRKAQEILAERDQLRAEIAGLKTGYEAYERVNAELKAEVERLRKDVDRAAYWKQRAKSAEGHLFSGDFRAAAMELHKYSRFESTPWPELTGSQHALISSAAGAVIATVNRLRDARRPKNRDETDAIIWCACGDGHAVNSYGAGFMDANEGVCANCDAALGKGEQS